MPHPAFTPTRPLPYGRQNITEADVAAVVAKERTELDRWVRRYPADRAAVNVAGRMMEIIDDGLAKSGTARVAVQVTEAQRVRRSVLAVPVAPATC